jgi:hypothetical protein
LLLIYRPANRAKWSPDRETLGQVGQRVAVPPARPVLNRRSGPNAST